MGEGPREELFADAYDTVNYVGKEFAEGSMDPLPSE